MSSINHMGYTSLAMPPKGRVADYVRGFSMSAWFLLMLAGFWWQTDYWARIDIEVRGNFFKFSLAGITIAMIFHLSLGMRKLMECPYLFPSSDVKSTLLMGFFLMMIVLSPMSLDPLRSAEYALATWGALCVCHWAWESNYETFRKVLVITGVLTFAFLAILLFKHGFIKGGVGGVQRNRYATSAFVAIIFCFFSKGRLRWLGILIGIGFIFLVNSRGSIVSLGLFFGTYLLLVKGFQKAVFAGAIMALAIALMILVPSRGGPDGNLVMDKILKVNDAARGSGSGLSGRVGYWEKGLSVFWRRPVIGYGFRTRTNETAESHSAHSGYIDMLLDSGMLGASFVLLAFATDFFRRVKRINRWKREFALFSMPENIKDSLRLNCIVCSMYVVMAALWVIEPLYLNLGATLSVLFLLLTSSPVTLPNTMNVEHPGYVGYAYR